MASENHGVGREICRTEIEMVRSMIKTGGEQDGGRSEEETVRRRLELAKVFKCGMLVEVDGNGALAVDEAGGGRGVGRRWAEVLRREDGGKEGY